MIPERWLSVEKVLSKGAYFDSNVLSFTNPPGRVAARNFFCVRNPMLVAGRYLPMQHLIGPDVFPLYWYVLQAVLIVITVIGGLLAGIALLTEPRAVQAMVQVAPQESMEKKN